MDLLERLGCSDAGLMPGYVSAQACWKTCAGGLPEAVSLAPPVSLTREVTHRGCSVYGIRYIRDRSKGSICAIGTRAWRRICAAAPQDGRQRRGAARLSETVEGVHPAVVSPSQLGGPVTCPPRSSCTISTRLSRSPRRRMPIHRIRMVALRRDPRAPRREPTAAARSRMIRTPANRARAGLYMWVMMTPFDDAHS
jgi:hypothetical protein